MMRNDVFTMEAVLLALGKRESKNNKKMAVLAQNICNGEKMHFVMNLGEIRML